MTTQELREGVTRKPFVPFVLRTADGASYAVPSPEWILYPQPTRVVVIYQDKRGHAVLDLLTIVALEYTQDFDRSGRDPPAEHRIAS